MAIARNWPRSLCPSSISFQPNIASASGGASVAGEEQLVFSSAGRWKASFSLYQHFRRDTQKLLAIRGMIAFLKGRTNRVLIGPYDYGKSPGALAGGFSTNTTGGIPHDDDELFDDGEGYSEGRTSSVANASAALGSLSMEIAMFAGEPIQPGQYFGIGTKYLHLVDGAELVSEAGSQKNYEVTFWPPLRIDVPYLLDINFDTPTCEMRLASDDGAGVTVDRHMVSGHQLELVEAL